MPRVKKDEFVELTLVVSVEGVKAAAAKASVPLRILSVELPNDQFDSMVRSSALKLIATLGIRDEDRAALKTRMKQIAARIESAAKEEGEDGKARPDRG